MEQLILRKAIVKYGDQDILWREHGVSYSPWHNHGYFQVYPPRVISLYGHQFYNRFTDCILDGVKRKAKFLN